MTLRCRTAAGEQAWATVVPRSAADGSTVATMWARRAIQSLEEVNGVGRSARLSAGSREAAEVVRLEHGVRAAQQPDDVRGRRAPHAGRAERRPAGGAAGAGGAGGGVGRAARWPGAAPAGAVRRKIDQTDWVPRLMRSATRRGVGDSNIARVAAPTPPPAIAPAPAAAARVVEPAPDVCSVLMSQSADGHFAWSPELERLAAERVVRWAERWIEACRTAGVDPADSTTASVMTVKAVVLLRDGFADDRSTWARAAEKEGRFLAAVTGRSIADVTACLATG